jgi:hypothetical protein
VSEFKLDRELEDGIENTDVAFAQPWRVVADWSSELATS